VDKNYLIKLWAAEKETLLFYANTDKANTVLGKSSLKKLWRRLEMGTESEKSRIIIMKSVLFLGLILV
jgi:hypothetical protein